MLVTILYDLQTRNSIITMGPLDTGWAAQDSLPPPNQACYFLWSSYNLILGLGVLTALIYSPSQCQSHDLGKVFPMHRRAPNLIHQKAASSQDLLTVLIYLSLI